MMGAMKFRKKPVVIDATNWNGDVEDATRIVNWILQGGGTARYHDRTEGGYDDHGLMIDTLEGVMRANPGDWVVRGVAGEFYPCRPDIFDATYEPVKP